MSTQTNEIQEKQTNIVNNKTAGSLTNQPELSAGDMDISSVPQTVSTVGPVKTINWRQQTISKNLRAINQEISTYALDMRMLWATIAIENKASQLGWVGAAISDIEKAGQGYFIRFQNADIYYSHATGAYEVHGDISLKYYKLNAANGILGLPLTDETITPDDRIGRYNHFQGGSIYWTPSTGPKMVRGAIRDVWAGQGWERGALGYPVSDEYRKRMSNPFPLEYWSVFQNGAIYSKNNIAAPAVVAEISPQDLTNFVRKTFDRKLKAINSNIGIEGGINVLNISDWGYSLNDSRKRMITYEINCFYSHGLPGPDPTFRLELQFLFDLRWDSNTFIEPVYKTLVVDLKNWHISTTSVLGLDRFFSALLVKELPKQFPIEVQPIPQEVKLIDVLLTPQGGLKFLLAPDVDYPPAGEIRRIIFQDRLNYFLEQ